MSSAGRAGRDRDKVPDCSRMSRIGVELRKVMGDRMWGMEGIM